MAYSNVAATINLLQGFVASEFGDSARQNQGLSLLPEIVRQIASRAELDSTLDLHVSAPRLFDGSADIDVTADAVELVAVVFDNTEAATNTPVVYDDATVVEGTTVSRIKLSMAASTLQVVVFTEPMDLADLSWSVIDGDALDSSSTLAAANSVRGMFVYAS